MVARLLSVLFAWVALAGFAVAQGDVKLRVLHDHGNPVVSEMVELTIRGEYDLTVSLADMVFPNSPDYDWVQIDRDDWHKERVNGRLLQIFERKVAIFPSRAGAIEVGPVTHEVTYVTENGKRAEIDITAPAVTLNVKPFPGDYRPLSAQKLSLTDELSARPGQLKQNEVLTRRVTIEAQGTLGHYLPPRPDLSQPWMISFTAPETRETLMTENGPVARVVWEWQLRPHTGEPAILPGTGFPWFDSKNRRIEIAPLDPIPFGFSGFGSNFGNAEDGGLWRNRLLSLAVMASALICGLALLLWRHSPLQRSALMLRMRRMLPSPHMNAMRKAARQNDLPGLRSNAEKHLQWRKVPPRGLAELDQQLYAKAPTPGFDAREWLRKFSKVTKQSGG